MTDIHAFIEARLGEDEAAAHAATPGRWVVGGFPGAEYLPCDFVHAPDYTPDGFSDGQHVGDASVADGGMGPWAVSVRGSGFPRANAEHIARHNPARVLLEIEAKRKRLKLHTPVHVPYIDHNRIQQTGLVCEVCGDGGETPGALWPCATVKTDALPYAAHPDFKPQWALA